MPTQVWQMPIRQPLGSRAPAASPATISGVPGPASVSMPLVVNRTRPPVASVATGVGGRKRSTRSASGSPARCQCVGQGVEQAGRAAGPGLPGRPVGHRVGQRVRGEPAGQRGVPLDQAQPGGHGQPAQLRAEDDVGRGAVAVHQHRAAQRVRGGRGQLAQHAHDRGDAAAGGDEQQLLGHRVRQHELAGRRPDPQQRADRGAVRQRAGDGAAGHRGHGDRPAAGRRGGTWPSRCASARPRPAGCRSRRTGRAGAPGGSSRCAAAGSWCRRSPGAGRRPWRAARWSTTAGSACRAGHRAAAAW